jgi:hypothetical protein
MLRQSNPVPGYNIFWAEGSHAEEAMSELQEKIRQAEIDFEIVRGYGGPFLKENDRPKDIWYAMQALELVPRPQ